MTPNFAGTNTEFTVTAIWLYDSQIAFSLDTAGDSGSIVASVHTAVRAPGAEEQRLIFSEDRSARPGSRVNNGPGEHGRSVGRSRTNRAESPNHLAQAVRPGATSWQRRWLNTGL